VDNFRIRSAGPHLQPRTLLAWFLPAALFGSYLWFGANPNAFDHWLAPYSPQTREAWWIKTPADTELLINKAQQWDRNPADPSTHEAIRALAATLRAKGVRLLVSNHVMLHAGGEWDPRRGEIRLRPSTVEMGSQALAQALAHESAHVSQSCRAGGLSRNSEPMGIEVDPAAAHQQQLDSPLYKGPPSSKAVELEAYTVGANPPWGELLLNHYCQSRGL